MENTYLFIIWNKALYKRKEILNDLSDSFNIVKDVYIKWNTKNFSNNLLAFYGRKLGEPKGKIISSGTDNFEIILVEDCKPNNELRKTYDSETIINTNIFDKKQLYRSWTAGSHRIHSSDNKQETEHDLAVLFGPNYEEFLNKYSNGDIINIDTKGITGFDNIDDLKKSLKLFGNNIVEEIDNKLVVFAKCRYDIVHFLNCIKTNNENTYSLNIGNNEIKLYIFGELDGDLLNYSFDKLNNTKKEIVNNFDDFLNQKRNYVEVERKDTFFNKWTVFKNEIKLFIKKLS